MRIEAKMATPSPAERQELLTDIGRRLDHLPIGPMHLKVVVAIGLGLFFEVYEIFLSSTIATALKTQYGLGGRALELLLASSFLGMFIGAVCPSHRAGLPVWGEPRTRVPRCGRSQPALTRGSRTPVIMSARYRCAPQQSPSTSPNRFGGFGYRHTVRGL